MSCVVERLVEAVVLLARCAPSHVEGRPAGCRIGREVELAAFQ